MPKGLGVDVEAGSVGPVGEDLADARDLIDHGDGDLVAVDGLGGAGDFAGRSECPDVVLYPVAGDEGVVRLGDDNEAEFHVWSFGSEEESQSYR